MCSSSRYYQERAADCRAMAATMVTLDNRLAMLKIALFYDGLAEKAQALENENNAQDPSKTDTAA